MKYYFVRDAKLALGSALLKRLVISSYCRVPWSEAQWTRDERTKPVFRLADGTQPLLFNVSHQAGLVALLAVHNPPAPASAPSSSTSTTSSAAAGRGDSHQPLLQIGVDIVCAGERRDRDHKLIAEQGWPHYVDMHDSVFAPAEVSRLKDLPLSDIDRRLAYFYTLWCLREGYVKMTGEALLASWLCELDLRYYAPPGETGPEGRELEIWFRGKKVEDVEMKMERYEDEFMICTAVRRPDGLADDIDVSGPFEVLSMDAVLRDAEKLKGS